MSAPLWYQVYNKRLSFNEFLDRFNDRQFQEREVLPILFYRYFMVMIHMLMVLMF